MVRKTRHLTYMNKYIVMFSYENMMSAHIPKLNFAVLLLDQTGADPGFLKRGRGVRLPYFNQNVLKFPMKMEEFDSRGGFE